MCWYSSTCAAPPVEAAAGDRLAVRHMHGFWNWLVRDRELKARKPAPVCLADGSQVILRPASGWRKQFKLAADAKAVFHMDGASGRDLFVVEDGREFHLNRLPNGLVLDVMYVPQPSVAGQIDRVGELARHNPVGQRTHAEQFHHLVAEQ